MGRGGGAVSTMMGDGSSPKPLRRNTSLGGAVTRELKSVVSSHVSMQFEDQRVKQAGLWNEIRVLYAAKSNLLSLLKQFENVELAGKNKLQYYEDTRDNVGATALHVAILCDSDDVIEYLVTTYGEPLVCACYENEHGPRSPYHGETALHLAVVKGRFDVVKLLIQHGANPNAYASGDFFDRDEQVDKGSYLGATPLHFAVCTNQFDIAEYLLTHGADPSITDQYEHNALHLAVYYSRKELFDLIIERDQAFGGKLQEQRSTEKLTPLTLAARMADKDMLEYILNKARDLNWAFGHVREYLYPLDQIDTYGEDPGVLDIIVDHGSLNHASLIEVPPVKELLQEKWRRFARTAFILWLLQHLIVVISITVSIILMFDPNDYSGTSGTARMAMELIACILVALDVILFEFPDFVRVVIGTFRHRRVAHGAIVFFLVGWLFRAFLIVAIILRLAEADASSQRAIVSFVAVLAWLYLLNFGRGVKSIGKFILMTEHIAFGMRNWVYVFLIEIAAFAVGYEAIFFKEAPSQVYQPLYKIPEAIFTLYKWMMGEFDFSLEDVALSHSQTAAYFLFAVFTLIATVILFNLLIALMTDIFLRFQQQAHILSELEWAKTVLHSEKRGKFFGLGNKWRSGTNGAVLGMDPLTYYKAVIVRDADADVTDEAEAKRKARAPGYLSTHAQQSLSEWAEIMSQIKQKNAEGYIADWAELSQVLNVYEVFSRGSASRETMAYILYDLVFNNALNPDHGKKVQKSVRNAARHIAASLDRDNDDDIPAEAVCAFCHLSRMNVLNVRQKHCALIIVDMQNDYLNGHIPLLRDNAQALLQQIQRLRHQLPWKLVVFTQDWHPSDHCSFADQAENIKKRDEESHAKGQGTKAIGSRQKSVTTSIARTSSTGQEVVFTDDVDDMKWPPHCIENTEGASLHISFELEPGEIIVRKGSDKSVDSFSAFWDNKHSSQTELYGKLFDACVERVYVCGVGYDCQVGRTARDAATYGFETYVIEDASISFDDRWSREMALELQSYNVQTANTADLLKSRLNFTSEQSVDDAGLQDITDSVYRVKKANLMRSLKAKHHARLLREALEDEEYAKSHPDLVQPEPRRRTLGSYHRHPKQWVKASRLSTASMSDLEEVPRRATAYEKPRVGKVREEEFDAESAF